MTAGRAAGRDGTHVLDRARPVVEPVQALRQVTDAVGEQCPGDPARRPGPGAEQVLDEGRLSGAVGSGERDPFGSLYDESAVAVTQFGETTPSGHVRVGQVEVDVLLAADQRLGVGECLLRRADLRVEAGSQRARGDLRLGGPVARQDARDAAVLLCRAGGAFPARELGLGLDALAFLSFERLLGRTRGLYGGGLPFVGVPFPGAVRTAEYVQFRRVQFGGAVHVLEQLQVVADHDESAGPAVDQRGQAGPRGSVEIVGRLVEQRDRCTADPQPGEGRQHRLTAGDLVGAAVEIGCGETDLVELLFGAGLDVPVVADDVEMPFVGVTGLDSAQRGQRVGDAEQFRECGAVAEGQGLWQVSDLALDVDAAGGGSQLSGDQPQQGGFPGAVAPDQSCSAGSEYAVEMGERDRAVGPFEGEVVHDDRRVGGCRHVW